MALSDCSQEDGAASAVAEEGAAGSGGARDGDRAEIGGERVGDLPAGESEDRKSVSLRAMEKAAGAMDCRVVYAIVPRGGMTLMKLAERQAWRRKLEKGEG